MAKIRVAMLKPAEAKTIKLFEDANGHRPYAVWLKGLRDAQGRRRIIRRVQRLERGHYGDCEPVGEGVFELRLFFGPGYRVYFAEEGKNVIILLGGGTKDTQRQDVEVAKACWKEHRAHG